MKKYLALLLSLLMMISLCTTAFADSVTKRTMIVSGTEYSIETTRSGVVTVVDKSNGAKAVFDKNTGELTVKENDSSKEINININELIEAGEEKGSNSSTDNKYAYSTSTKYYNGSPYTFWQIQIPNQIKYTYEKNNVSNLINFQNNVDRMRSAQDTIKWQLGATGLAIILGLVASLPIAAIAAAIIAIADNLLTGGGSSIYDIIGSAQDIKNSQTNCVTYFNLVVPVSIP